MAFANEWRALAAALVFGVVSLAHAGPNPVSRANADPEFVAPGDAAHTLSFDGPSRRQVLALTASAGEPVHVDIDAAAIGQACGVALDVVDERGHAIAHEACVGASGAGVDFTAPHAGTYRLQFDARAGVDGRLAVSMARTALPRPIATDCQANTLALDQATAGSWDTSCASVTFAGHFAQYYTFTVPASQVISISLGSATNAYLVLHDGSSANGTTIATDDDSGPGTDALIVRSLPAGAYTIEATTAVAGQTGSFTIAARTNIAPCFAPLKLDKLTTGSWTTTCESQRFADTYAMYYTFTVPADQVVTLALDVADHNDPYLVLRYGNTQLGQILAEDDNSGPIRDSLIVLDLPAGTYTLEATTTTPGELGDFTIAARTDAKPCFNPLKLDKPAKGTWSDLCGSVYANDHYALFYTFNVPSPQIVTMSLGSLTKTTDPELVLRLGASPIGAVIATDTKSGAGTDSRIVMALNPGAYTLEATTTKPRVPGNFLIAARTDTAPCFAAGTLSGEIDGTLTTDCTSTTFDDRYAKYYVLNVPSSQTLTVQLASTAFDSYLVLRGGPDMQLGPILAQDDNSGGGTSAKIATTLAPGVYTIEVTSAGSLSLGAFQLTTGP